MAEVVAPDQKTTGPSPGLRRRPKRRLFRILVALAILAVLAFAAYKLWKYLGTYESTDDTQIDGDIFPISTRITGHIVDVLVEDAQVVKAGDILVKIDPNDYRVAVAQAEANLADAEALCSVRASTYRSSPRTRPAPWKRRVRLAWRRMPASSTRRGNWTRPRHACKMPRLR